MILIHIFSRIKNIFITILAATRRGLCCFSRKRKPSYSECELLTSVNVDPVQTNNYSNKHGGERDWNSWDDSPRTVDEHIEQYRNRLAQSKQLSVDNAEPAVDFFGDMEPKVLKQKKVFIDTGKRVDNFSRLQATGAAAIPHIQTTELEDWSDNENDNENGPAGWDEIDDETTRRLIREKKREIRAQRQQQQQQQQQQRAKHQHH